MGDGPLVGREGAAFSMPVERGKVREFAAAVLTAHDAYVRDPAPVVPPTFLATAAFWDEGGEELWADVGLDPARSVHGEQEYVFRGPPPRAGTVLEARTRIESDVV